MPIYYGTSCTTATTCSAQYVWATMTAGTSSSTAPMYYYAPVGRAYYSSSAYCYEDGGRSRQAAQIAGHAKEAKTRAKDLLLANLTPEQRETFEKKKWFVVEGGKSKAKYRIHEQTDLVANIAVIDGDRVTHRLCGHCDPAKVPMGDQLLAQKMMLEFAEDDFLRLANRHAA